LETAAFLCGKVLCNESMKPAASGKKNNENMKMG
jgi:hypothetical protein